MIRHFFISLLLYSSIILSALLVLGVAKQFSQEHEESSAAARVATCKAFKFEKC
jgi:hypothetical protein